MRGVLTDGVDVANAALADVGLPPTCYRGPNGGVAFVTSGMLAYRAAVLGTMAEGVTVVRCWPCSLAPDKHERCTPALDALRGITCRDSDQD